MFKKWFKTSKKKDEQTVRIQGEKCYLRTFSEGDARELASLLSRNKYFWSTYEPLHRDAFYTEQEQYKKILEGLQMMALKREYSFGIYSNETDILIGHISLYAIKKLPYSSAFVGYAMDEQFTKRGIATEAVKLVTKFAFNYLNLHRIEAYISPKNIGSIRVVEKIGFQKEGLLRELLFINGYWVDHYLYAILNQDFAKRL